ncbi:uncharacterized protein LOC131006188 [Salvia miltiorrhiza]|uniref:uncharacterized protein LOC131006188 n=1 Tax=Salvia miltiorrhiza TaxID=226208 RepID=UPI0025AD98DC|nr:uncharacterized protein LOC131006188 [Salvia miltiorrhiza]
MTEGFNKMESRFIKYKKFHKKNFKGKEKEYKLRYSKSNDKFEEKKPSTPDLKDVKCFGCDKKGHYKTGCPEISYLERKALRAKRDFIFSLRISWKKIKDWRKRSVKLGLKRKRPVSTFRMKLGKTKKQNKKKEEAKAPNNTWYLDCGCSKHMTGCKEYLTQYVEKAGSKVVFGDNSLGETKGYSELNMGNVCISNVSYVSLSVSQFCDSGFSVKIKRDEFTVRNNNKKEVLNGVRQGKLYVVSWEDSSPETCLISKSHAELNTIWHRRLNHLNFKTINKVAKHQLVEGLPQIVFQKKQECGACQ